MSAHRSASAPWVGRPWSTPVTKLVWGNRLAIGRPTPRWPRRTRPTPGSGRRGPRAGRSGPPAARRAAGRAGARSTVTPQPHRGDGHAPPRSGPARPRDPVDLGGGDGGQRRQHLQVVVAEEVLADGHADEGRHQPQPQVEVLRGARPSARPASHTSTRWLNAVDAQGQRGPPGQAEQRRGPEVAGVAGEVPEQELLAGRTTSRRPGRVPANVADHDRHLARAVGLAPQVVDRPG